MPWLSYSEQSEYWWSSARHIGQRSKAMRSNQIGELLDLLIISSLWFGPWLNYSYFHLLKRILLLILRLILAILLLLLFFLQLSYADTHPMFTKKSYPNFFRIVPSESAFNAPRVKLLKAFNWTRVGTLYQNEPRFALVSLSSFFIFSSSFYRRLLPSSPKASFTFLRYAILKIKWTTRDRRRRRSDDKE